MAQITDIHQAVAVVTLLAERHKAVLLATGNLPPLELESITTAVDTVCGAALSTLDPAPDEAGGEVKLELPDT